MNNPYQILEVSQDASNQEIIRAVAVAMSKRRFSTREIAEARAILSKPASRLAADFTFPIFPKQKQISLINATVTASGITVNDLDVNKYNSL
jgi:DnaJ-class molecular chaperone